MGARIEIFTDGGSEGEQAISKVRELACSKCEIMIYDLRLEGKTQAEAYGVVTLPAVVMNGKIVDLQALK